MGVARNEAAKGTDGEDVSAVNVGGEDSGFTMVATRSKTNRKK
jgi:hypothetical protein